MFCLVDYTFSQMTCMKCRRENVCCKETNNSVRYRMTRLKFVLLLLGHVFPVTAGHVAQLFAGVDALPYADGFEVGSPEVLQQSVVAAQHLFVQLAVGKVEWHC